MPYGAGDRTHFFDAVLRLLRYEHVFRVSHDVRRASHIQIRNNIGLPHLQYLQSCIMICGLTADRQSSRPMRLLQACCT